MAAPQQQQIDLNSLTIDNLAAVKKQLDDEIEHLMGASTKLKKAQDRFREYINAVKAGVKMEVLDKPLLIPLTTSLFVPAKLSDPEHVLVDVGTGYFVEKTAPQAVKFYTEKIKTIETNMADIQKVMTQKLQNVRIVESVIVQKQSMGGQ
ncbi:Prefoldin [Pyronema omphalodes]|nr:Prefoldin [Pyronema omphalodes]